MSFYENTLITKQDLPKSELKKIVLEALQGDRTLAEIASTNNITPKNIQNWKEKFLANAQMAMEPSKAIKEYKDENLQLQKRLDEYAKTVGQLTVENNWMQGKSPRLKFVNSDTDSNNFVEYYSIYAA